MVPEIMGCDWPRFWYMAPALPITGVTPYCADLSSLLRCRLRLSRYASTSAAFFSYLASSISFSCLPARLCLTQQKMKMARIRTTTPITTPMMIHLVVLGSPFHFCSTLWVADWLFSPSSWMGLVSLSKC